MTPVFDLLKAKNILIKSYAKLFEIGFTYDAIEELLEAVDKIDSVLEIFNKAIERG